MYATAHILYPVCSFLFFLDKIVLSSFLGPFIFLLQCGVFNKYHVIKVKQPTKEDIYCKMLPTAVHRSCLGIILLQDLCFVLYSISAQFMYNLERCVF